MTNSLDTLRQHHEDEAEKWRRRAAEATAPALREYYRGRADAAQAAADALQKYLYDHSQNPFTHEHTDAER